jgi:hypothetical protein
MAGALRELEFGQVVRMVNMAKVARVAKVAMAAMAGAMATGLGLSNSEWVAVVLNLDDFEWAIVGLHMLREVGAKVLAEAKRLILSAFGWVVD